MTDFTQRRGFDSESRKVLRSLGITGRELRAGRPYDDGRAKRLALFDTRYYGVVVLRILAIFAILCAIGIGLLSCSPAHAEDDCQDPEKLSPELREAYYQLEEAEKVFPEMKVSIRCYENQEEDKNVEAN